MNKSYVYNNDVNGSVIPTSLNSNDKLVYKSVPSFCSWLGTLFPVIEDILFITKS